jgi:hypothetical protein
MAEKSKKVGCWVHVKILNKELVEKLDEMSNSDERDRSKFIRWLIQQEWIRRNSQTFFGKQSVDSEYREDGDIMRKTSIAYRE